jgi:hypothetical protein
MPGIQKAALTPVDQAIDRLRRTSRASELLLSNPPASTSVALRGGVRLLDLADVAAERWYERLKLSTCPATS